MSKRLVAYSVLFTIGLVITIHSFYKLDFKFSNIPTAAFGEAIEGTESFESHEVKKIDCDFSASLVTIKAHNDETSQIIVNYEHYSNIKVEMKVEHEVLKIKSKHKFVWWNAFSFGTDTGDIEIIVPQNMTFNYEIENSAGKVDLINVFANILNLDLSAGEVKIQNSQINDAKIGVSAGDIHITNSRITKLNANVSAGGIFSTRLECDKLDFDVSAGTIKLELVGNKKDYNVDVDVSAGSCNISDYNDKNNTRYIKGDVSAGDARFTFVN